jgi:hypothetical protein
VQRSNLSRMDYLPKDDCVCVRNRLLVRPTLSIAREQLRKRSAAMVANQQECGSTNVLTSHMNAVKSDRIFCTNNSLAVLIMGQSRPWSDRYLFSAFNAPQRVSTAFNEFQRLSTPTLTAMLKRVEQLAAVTFRTSLEGRSTRSVGREFPGLKRSVRVHAFTCQS